MSRRTRPRALPAVALGVAAVLLVWLVSPAGASTPSVSQPLADHLAACEAMAEVAQSHAEKAWAEHCVDLATRALAAQPAESTPTAEPTTPAPTAPAPTTPAPTTTAATPPPPTTTSPPATDWPTAATTGVPDGTDLSVVLGGMRITTAGTVVSGKEIRGCVEVRAANVTIRDSRILGNGCFYAVRNYSTGLTMTDVEITCGGTAGTGVTATNYTLIRADISGCENGLNIGGNVTMTDSWIHDLAMVGGDPHTDGVQINQGAGNVLLRHNRFEAPRWSTSSIIMWNEGDPQNRDVLVEDNWLSGGGYVVYCPRRAATNVRVVNNRIGNWGYGPQDSCRSPNATFSGNTRLDGSPL